MYPKFEINSYTSCIYEQNARLYRNDDTNEVTLTIRCFQDLKVENILHRKISWKIQYIRPHHKHLWHTKIHNFTKENLKLFSNKIDWHFEALVVERKFSKLFSSSFKKVFMTNVSSLSIIFWQYMKERREFLKRTTCWKYRKLCLIISPLTMLMNL